MALFTTHTGLTLATLKDGDEYLVTLTGDREKVLYRGPDQVEQQRVYSETKKLYQGREEEAKQT